MDAQLKKKWIEALRSGEYKQGQRNLRNGNSYCCLGVLCDLSDVGKWMPTEYGSVDYCAEGEFRGAFPPKAVRESAGLSRHQENDVADMNDEGKSFGEIADYIEANIPADAA